MTQPLASEPLLVDHAVIEDLVDHIGIDAARSVVGLFLNETSDFVNRIETAPGGATGCDIARRAAHSLKSSAGQLGAIALAMVAEEVERVSQKGEEAPRERIAALGNLARETAVALTDLLRRRG